MPLSKEDAKALVGRRHPEWAEHQSSWRRLADALEGGDRYRYADYAGSPHFGPGPSPATGWGGSADPQTGEVPDFGYGSVVSRNLVPHRGEMDREGYRLYAMRLSRTPVPTALARTVESHLAKVFAREVRREGPPILEDWWADVDGLGMPVGRWVKDTLAPLLLVLGQIDIVVDHPPRPEGLPATAVRSKADATLYGLDLAIPGILLPEMVVWWRLDNRGRYAELLTAERTADPDPKDKYPTWFRHWHAAGSDAYSPDGAYLPDRSYAHNFGRVPVVRVFDRKKPRCRNVGKSRYEGIAELQKAAYNAESERILADVHSSHPTLMAPAEALGPNSTVRVGPDGTLPMVPLQGADGMTRGYQPWAYLDPPAGSQASLRDHLVDLGDAIDRDGAIAKPAGAAGGTVTAQSGISKVMDSVDGNAILGRIAEVLEAAEHELARLAHVVLTDGTEAPPGSVAVAYPKQFDLYSADDVAAALDAVQGACARAGALPLTEAALLKRLAGLALPGLPEEQAGPIFAEIDAFAEKAGIAATRAIEAAQAGASSDDDPDDDPETEGLPRGSGSRPPDDRAEPRSEFKPAPRRR